MKIKLDDKHYLNSDECCYWITVEVVAEETGKIYERRVSGYTPTFEGAVESLIEKRIKKAQIDDFKGLLQVVNDLKREVRSWRSAVESEG